MQDRVGPDRIEQVAFAADHAERRVVVTGNALRRRVQREMDAMGERLLAERSGERGVDDGDGTAQAADFVEVDDLQQRGFDGVRRWPTSCARPQRGGEAPGWVPSTKVTSMPSGVRPLQERERGRGRAGVEPRNA